MTIFPTYCLPALRASRFILAPRYIQGLKIDLGPHKPTQHHLSATQNGHSDSFLAQSTEASPRGKDRMAGVGCMNA